MVEVKSTYSYSTRNFYTPGIVLLTEDIMVTKSRHKSCSQEFTFSYKVEVVTKYINRYTFSSAIGATKPKCNERV